LYLKVQHKQSALNSFVYLWERRKLSQGLSIRFTGEGKSLRFQAFQGFRRKSESDIS
jgi:hypothetical protein